MKKEQADPRQSYIQKITIMLLKKFVSPLTNWASNTQLVFTNTDTCKFTLVLIKPLEEMTLSELEAVSIKYKTAFSMDTIIRLNKEKELTGSSDNTESSFTRHDHVPTLKGESLTFEKALHALFSTETSIEEARSKPYIAQLYKVAHDDITHKFLQKYAPVMESIIEEVGGKVVMTPREDNSAIVDVQVTMPDNCIRGLSALLFFRSGDQIAAIDHAALLNLALPPNTTEAKNRWHQSKAPGYCFERVVSKAEYAQFTTELNELRLALRISFEGLTTLQTALSPDTHDYATAQVELSSPTQMHVLKHLHPGAIVSNVRQVLDGIGEKYSLELLGPLSFKLTLKSLDPQTVLEGNHVTMIDTTRINEIIRQLASHYQLSITECDGAYLFKATKLLPQNAPQAQASSAENNNQTPSKTECLLSLNHRKAIALNISKKTKKLTLPTLSKLLFSLKMSFKDEDELEVFKSKFEEALLKLLNEIDNIQDLTSQRIQDLANNLPLTESSSLNLSEASIDCFRDSSETCDNVNPDMDTSEEPYTVTGLNLSLGNSPAPN